MLEALHYNFKHIYLILDLIRIFLEHIVLLRKGKRVALFNFTIFMELCNEIYVKIEIESFKSYRNLVRYFLAHFSKSC